MDEKNSVVSAPPQSQLQQQRQPVAVLKPGTPHSFLACSICVAICCGIFSPGTLACTIPAAILSCFSYAASKKGNVGRGKFLGNISLTMVIIALMFGLLWILIGMLIFAIFAGRLIFCGLTTPASRMEICNRIF